MKKYYIKTKQKSAYPFDAWLTKLEMRAFGWHYKGYDIDYEDTYDLNIDFDKKEATLSRRFKVYTTFKRVAPYSYNPIFVFLEAIMTIQSWIRRKLIFLLFGITVLLLIFGGIETYTRRFMSESLIAGISIIAGVYGPSIITMILGFITRKIFFIESRLKRSLEKNGYKRNQNL